MSKYINYLICAVKLFVYSFIWPIQRGRKSRIVVYTAIFGDSDDLIPPRRLFRKIPFVNFVCFTDNETLKSDVWDIKVVKTQKYVSARLCAKDFKILPNKYFSHYEYSIWMDGNRRLAVDPRQLILKFLKDKNIALFSHDGTDCCYEEGERCKAQAKDYAERIDAQLAKYRNEGFPTHKGLTCNSVIFRNHNLPEVIDLMKLWFEEIITQSERDQLSLPYVRWKARIPVTVIPNKGTLKMWFPSHDHRLELLYPEKKGNIDHVDICAVDKTIEIMFVGNWEKSSGRWVGKDVACELSKYFRVAIGTKYYKRNPAKITLFTKLPPGSMDIESAKATSNRIMYMPVDYFDSEQEIKEHHGVLKSCDGIFLHSRSLLPFFSHYAPCHLIDHYSKYAIHGVTPYKKTGFILWIGQFEHIAYILDYLKNHRLPYPIKFLSNMKSNSSWKLGVKICKQMGVLSELKNYRIEEWNEKLQYQYMKDAKAAIDIKGTNFNQITKPPTKIQQYLLSGIPPAINPGCNSYDHIKSQGFNICRPTDIDRWLSAEYWEEVQNFKAKISEVCSLKKVAESYKNIFEKSQRDLA